MKCQTKSKFDRHWRQWESKEKLGGVYWALWDHPDNISARAYAEQVRLECEELDRLSEQRQRQWQIENAPRLAKEKFEKELSEYLVDNYDEPFILFRKIHAHFMKKSIFRFSKPIAHTKKVYHG